MSNPEIEDIVLSPGYITPERTHAEPSRALFAAWQNCAIDQHSAPEDRALQQQLLQNITENAYVGLRDEHVREQLKRSSEILEYFWFGNDTTPLPSGLRRFLVEEHDTPVLSLNPNVLDFRSLDATMQLLGNAGLDNLIRYRQKLYEKQSGFVFEPLARSLAANTPGYRLLESFNATLHVWKDRPLTPVERVIEEQVAERTVRMRHGLDEREPIFAHPGAQHELHRAIHRLNEATRYDRYEQPQKPPHERVYNFFTQLIIDDTTVEGEYLKDVKTAEVELLPGRKSQLLDITTNAVSFRTDGESIATFAESQGYLSTPSTSRARAISAGLVSDMVLHLFNKHDGQERDYSEVLMELLARHTADLVDDLGKLAVGNFNRFRFNALATLLTAPTEFDEEVSVPVFFAPAMPEILRSDRIVSRKEYRERQRDTYGHILKRSHEGRDMRIMQYRSPNEPLGELDENASDMILHLPGLSEALVPYVIGYETIGHDAKRQLFGLRYTPEADPYTECPAVIPEDSKRSLASTYADIGLGDLALIVHSTPNLTVNQLTQYIARANRYSLPAKEVQTELPGSLGGYAEQVKDGRLHMQCVGSSHFLRLSLEAVFGEGFTGIIGGDTIPAGSNRLTNAGHQQTTFIDPETRRLYVLDATSSGFYLTLWREMLAEHMGALRRTLGVNALKALSNDRVAPPAPVETLAVMAQQPISKEATTHDKSEGVLQVKDALILQLRMLYGQDGQPMPQDRMFEIVARLPDDDIVFRSLSAAMLVAEGKMGSDDVEQILHYIEDLQRCDDPALLRKVDPRGYATQTQLLGVLHGQISQLAQLVDQ